VTVDDDFAGKVAVVVGGSSGIGKAVAGLLADRGCDVFCLARNGQRLDHAVAELGNRVQGLACDASDPADVRRAFATVAAEFGRLDILLNVAGTASPTLIEDATDDDISRHLATNLLAPIYTTRAAIPLLKASGAGDIVNVSSEVTIDLFPLLTLYGTSKAGLEMFSRAMTKELRPHNIRVTLFICGQTDTAFGRDWSGDQVAAAVAAWSEDGAHLRVSGPNQMEAAAVAEAMVFAVSRPRSQMIDIMQVRSV